MEAIRKFSTGGYLLLLMTLSLGAHAEKAQSADAFVDSVGINVHLHFLDTSYSNFPLVLQSLQQLGIRHVRDGLTDTTWQGYYDHHNQLGRAGIKGIFITAPNETSQLLVDYPRRMRDSFEGYEAPNEFDHSSDPAWPAALTAFVTRLNQAVKGDSRTARFPVIGPSFTQPDSFTKLRGVCSFDFENLHNYFGGRNPGTPGWGANGYGSISYNLALSTTACPGKPVFTTETGYQTDVALTQGIPEDAAARYLPRVFLEQWLGGIRRTYLYELVDLPPGRGAGDSSFGLLRSDFSPKPAYSALMNLLHLLSDPGPSYTAGDFNFAITGDVANLHHALFQKRNGFFYLAIWVEQPGYDVNTKKVLSVPAHHIVIQTDQKLGVMQHSLDSAGAVNTKDLGINDSHPVDINDTVTILEFDHWPKAPTMSAPQVQ